MRVARLLLALCLVACGASPDAEPVIVPEPEPTTVTQAPPPREPPIETIEPGVRVPSFKVTTVDGQVIDSRALIGVEPFVVVHFASWCKVCDVKLPMVKSALERLGQPIKVIGVAWDEEESWDKVPPYVERHGIGMQVVRAEHEKRFAIGYDPFGGFPLLIVVDKLGLIAEFQMGLAPSHEAKLDAALSGVMTLGPTGGETERPTPAP